MGAPATGWLGKSVERIEDAALLAGRGRYIDDLGVRPDTLHAAILRSPHAHAVIRAVRAEAARGTPGVAAVLTGAEVKALTAALLAGSRRRSNAGRSRSTACATSASRSPWRWRRTAT
jgi:2-furoyl-CoA dehydrogenase large subunit